MYSEIAQVYLGSAAYRVYKQMSDKRFGMHLKIGKFVCIKSSLQCMHHLYFFYRNSKISRNSSYRFFVKLCAAEDI